MNIDFSKTYIEIDFDKILNDKKNPLVNSDELYINFKQDYFDQTKQTYDKIINLKVELDSLSNVYINNETNTKYTFIYKDNNLIENKKQQIKMLYLQQEKRYRDFYNHVLLLNSDNQLLMTKKSNVKQSFLSKLVSSFTS